MLIGKRDAGPLEENSHRYDALYVTIFRQSLMIKFTHLIMYKETTNEHCFII